MYSTKTNVPKAAGTIRSWTVKTAVAARCRHWSVSLALWAGAVPFSCQPYGKLMLAYATDDAILMVATATRFPL
jgi:hypothetical protein